MVNVPSNTSGENGTNQCQFGHLMIIGNANLPKVSLPKVKVPRPRAQRVRVPNQSHLNEVKVQPMITDHVYVDNVPKTESVTSKDMDMPKLKYFI